MNAACHRAACAVLAASALSVAAAPGPDPAAVAEVLAGQRTEARAEWWGFNPTNATAALQAALTSGARRVVVGNCGGPWIVDPLALPGNLEVVFEPGVVVEARRGGYRGKGDCLFSADTRTNLVLSGPGATLRMWQEDYASTNYAPAEWRHAVLLRACVNVRIEGLVLARSGGDGIYLGAGARGEPCRNVVIRDVVCDGHHRQGISVISAEDLRIERCALVNTRGTAPMAGIDFEPNHARERLVDCVMRDCVLTNNAGGALLFALHNMTGASEPVSFRVERCRTSDNLLRGAVYWNSASGSNGSTRGTAVFADCSFLETTGHVVTVYNPAAAVSSLAFSGCRIETRDPSRAPILLAARPDAPHEIGGVVIEGGRLAAADGVRPLEWKTDGRLRALRRVTGRFEFEAGSLRETVVLDDRRLAAWFPDVAAAMLPAVAIDPVRDVPASAATGAVWRLRGEADLVFRAVPGQEVELAVRVQPIGPAPHRIPVRVTGPSGAVVLQRTVEAGAEAVLGFAAAEDGMHRIEAGGGPCAFRIRSATSALCAVTDRKSVSFFCDSGEYGIRVPAGVGPFAVRVTGSGGEGVKAAILDPSGRIVQTQDDISRPAVLRVERSASPNDEVWRLRLERPSTLRLEDYSLQILGIPPLLVPSAH
ncbi:MAG: right-handed parallel beta-helix repeat-containing protein [Verrucomicrobia bacterium]|nr:right-handed parallel beta-helix repeat-containing protein [Verrucomicrobiota bacterium]